MFFELATLGGSWNINVGFVVVPSMPSSKVLPIQKCFMAPLYKVTVFLNFIRVVHVWFFLFIFFFNFWRTAFLLNIQPVGLQISVYSILWYIWPTDLQLFLFSAYNLQHDRTKEDPRILQMYHPPSYNLQYHSTELWPIFLQFYF